MVTGDSKEEVMIFRDKQTLHHNIYIIIITVKTISTNVAITILTRESEKVGGFCSYNSEKEEN